MPVVVSCTTGQYIYISLTTKPQCVYGIYCPGGSFDLRHRWATNNSYSTVARDLWQRKPPLFLDLGQFTAINPWPCAITNYDTVEPPIMDSPRYRPPPYNR